MDEPQLSAVFQFLNNTYAHRFVLLAAADAEGSVCFLPPFLKGVTPEIPDEECSSHICFLHDLPCTPVALLEWMRTSIMSATIHRVYFVQPGPGLESLQEVAAELNDPTHVFHGTRVRLMCFPRVLEGPLSDEVCTHLEMEPRQYGHILFVVRCLGRFRWAALTAAQYGGPCMGPTPLRELKVGTVVASAIAKLHEALALSGASLGPTDVAIDIGASPGSWAAYLAGVVGVRAVLAVDPAEIDPGVLALPGVVHVRAMSHAALPRLRQLLLQIGGGCGNGSGGGSLATSSTGGSYSSSGGGVSGGGGSDGSGFATSSTSGSDGSGGGGDGSGGDAGIVRGWQGPAAQAPPPPLADALVCDMNKHPGTVPALLTDVLPLLRPGGLVVVTLKFFGRGYARDGFFEVLRRELGPMGLVSIRFAWLFANTSRERMMFATYAGPPQPPVGAAVTPVPATAALAAAVSSLVLASSPGSEVAAAQRVGGKAMAAAAAADLGTAAATPLQAAVVAAAAPG